jgi:hypothetical protein
MGDRSQVVIKSGEERVYLYSHWGGSDVYKSAARALDKAPDRHSDSEYLARIVFQEMIGENTGTTGFGIGVSKHLDTEHPFLVLDCDAEEAYFEPAPYGKEFPEGRMKFPDFSAKALAGEFDSL